MKSLDMSFNEFQLWKGMMNKGVETDDRLIL